jgi:hypothetical protein
MGKSVTKPSPLMVAVGGHQKNFLVIIRTADAAAGESLLPIPSSRKKPLQDRAKIGSSLIPKGEKHRDTSQSLQNSPELSANFRIGVQIDASPTKQPPSCGEMFLKNHVCSLAGKD